MEPIFKCDLCSSQFTVNCVPYELPCKHKYCYKCLSSICKSNEETIVCKKDDKTFNEKIIEVPIASFFLNFLNQTLTTEPRLICSDHNNKKIKFLCHEHNFFLCSLCFWDHCEHKKSTALYNSEDFTKDLKKVEDRLIELEEKLKLFLSQIHEIKSNQINSSKRVSLFFTEASKFLKTPFIEKIEKEKNDSFPLVGVFGTIINSKILSDENDLKFISNSWEKPMKNWKLLFRASEFNYDSQIFHQKCDNKGSTVTLIKSKNGKIFGGYNKASWNCNGYFSSQGSFIFSVDNKTKHEIYQNQDYAMYGNSNYGPTFGGGHDIYIANSCNNNTSSYTNFGNTFKLPGNIWYNTDSAKNYFTGSYNFGIEEYEVFLV